MSPTRREVLVASAALPLGAVASYAPLAASDLRVLAMCATPPSAWNGREDEYETTRIAAYGTDLHRILLDLEARGLVSISPTYSRIVPEAAIATSAGIAELRKLGVEI
jgi:hypothetical protein